MATANKKKPANKRLGEIKPIYNTSSVIKSVRDAVSPIFKGKKRNKGAKK
jgi:hypothetical protein